MFGVDADMSIRGMDEPFATRDRIADALPGAKRAYASESVVVAIGHAKGYNVATRTATEEETCWP